MAAVSWQYPLDSLAKLKEQQRKADQGLPVADGVNVERLNFDFDHRPERSLAPDSCV